MELANGNSATSRSSHFEKQQRPSFPYLADACLRGKYLLLLRFIIKGVDHINA